MTELRRGLPRVKGGPAWPAPELPAADAPRAPRAGLPRVQGGEPELDPPSGQRGRRVVRIALAAALTAGSAVLLVLVARWGVALPAVAAFIREFPGSYPSTVVAAPGVPAWLSWQHFLNGFLLLLIIKTGIQVRTQGRPPMRWTGRRPGSRAISITLWLHLVVDALWLANGVLYVILLAVSGRWPRVVPTSWEVFPNAVSAALQYVTLQWPHENGWVTYNALQQLSYFVAVFVLAPLAAVTGFRMSILWPNRAERLSRVLPLAVARRLHFPVMLAFTGFIVIHVALVLTTGALRNLNHMYAGRDADDVTGLLVFGASLLMLVAGWLSARPAIAAAFARLVGTVTR